MSHGAEPELRSLDDRASGSAAPTLDEVDRPGEPGHDEARPGLVTLHAMLADAAARLELRSLTVEVDDPDLGRQAFRAGPGPFGPGSLLGEPGCRTDPPLPPGHFESTLLVALCAASLRVEVLEGDADGADAAEIALRRLPGVVEVVVERDEDLLMVEVHAGQDAPSELARIAARAAAPFASGPIAVEIVRVDSDATPHVTSGSGEATSTPSGSASVVAVRSVPESGEIEVLWGVKTRSRC